MLIDWWIYNKAKEFPVTLVQTSQPTNPILLTAHASLLTSDDSMPIYISYLLCGFTGFFVSSFGDNACPGKDTAFVSGKV